MRACVRACVQEYEYEVGMQVQEAMQVLTAVLPHSHSTKILLSSNELESRTVLQYVKHPRLQRIIPSWHPRLQQAIPAPNQYRSVQVAAKMPRSLVFVVLTRSPQDRQSSRGLPARVRTAGRHVLSTLHVREGHAKPGSWQCLGYCTVSSRHSHFTHPAGTGEVGAATRMEHRGPCAGRRAACAVLEHRKRHAAVEHQGHHGRGSERDLGRITVRARPWQEDLGHPLTHQMNGVSSLLPGRTVEDCYRYLRYLEGDSHPRQEHLVKYEPEPSPPFPNLATMQALRARESSQLWGSSSSLSFKLHVRPLPMPGLIRNCLIDTLPRCWIVGTVDVVAH